MDNMSYRNNRPAPRADTPEPAAAAPRTPAQPAISRAKHSSKEPKSRRMLAIVGLLLVVVALAAGAWFFMGRGTTSAAIDGSKYQAVFFTYGQVYFGKLSSVNGEYMRLKNVYYLQNKEAAADETSPQSASKQDASFVELIKLGNEIHGPEDEMLVSKNQILFFENLKPAGTVSKTIANFQQTNQ